MNKQILLILVLAVAWTFSGVAAPGPTDPAGADRNAENGAALAPESDTASAPSTKPVFKGGSSSSRRPSKTYKMVCGESTRPERLRPPKPTPPRPLTPEPEPIPLPTPTPAPKPPPTRARKPPRRSTRPNFEARSSSSRPSSKTPCGKTSAAPFSALPREPTWRATGPSFPPKPASTASAPLRLSVPGPTARRSWTRPTGRLWSGWSVSRTTSARPWPNTAPCWGS